jgi:pyruvate formate lyase activating enzyme
MLLGGLQKTTVIDFPKRVACTVFTVGCNFRCPFCHNKDLITKNLFNKAGLALLKEEDFFDFLKNRKKILDGVCITGGEPTLQPDLLRFCKKIKKLGLEVKLDSNGSNPKALEDLLKEKVVDFIAMDIKTSFTDYKKAIGVNYPVENIKKSIDLILASGLEYEFRTTIVPGIHNKESLVNMAKDLEEVVKKHEIKPQDFNYALQIFKPQNCFDPKFLKIHPFSDKEIRVLFKTFKKTFPRTKLKGAD